MKKRYNIYHVSRKKQSLFSYIKNYKYDFFDNKFANALIKTYQNAKKDLILSDRQKRVRDYYTNLRSLMPSVRITTSIFAEFDFWADAAILNQKGKNYLYHQEHNAVANQFLDILSEAREIAMTKYKDSLDCDFYEIKESLKMREALTEMLNDVNQKAEEILTNYSKILEEYVGV